jgi:hypothetical protein
LVRDIVPSTHLEAELPIGFPGLKHSSRCWKDFSGSYTLVYNPPVSAQLLARATQMVAIISLKVTSLQLEGFEYYAAR